MKKALAILLGIALAGGALTVSAISYAKVSEAEYSVKAEGEETPAETTEPTEEIDTEEKLTEKVKKWLSQYLDARLVADIITWATTGGLMTALFTVYLKYRRYKAMTTDDLVRKIKSEVGKALKESFSDLSKEEIKTLSSSICDLKDKTELMMKALVLAQDKTSESKIALLELITSESDSKEVKDAAEKATESVKKEAKAKEEAKEAIKEGYRPIE